MRTVPGLLLLLPMEVVRDSIGGVGNSGVREADGELDASFKFFAIDVTFERILIG